MQKDVLTCPQCGKPLNRYDWGWGCSGYEDGCRFSVGKICGKILSEHQMEELIEKGRVGPIKGFVSKKGKEFEASLVLEDDEKDGTPVKTIRFDFGTVPVSERPDIYARCPKCGATIVKGTYGWECSDKCGVSVPYELCHRKLSKEEAEALFSQGETAMLEGFVSKKGKPFEAELKLDPDEDYKLKFEFPYGDY